MKKVTLRLKFILAGLLATTSLITGGASLVPPEAVYGFSCSEASARIYEGPQWSGRSFVFCFRANVLDFRQMAITDCDGRTQDNWLNCASSIITKCGSVCGYFCLNTGTYGQGAATLRIIGAYTGTFRNRFIGGTPIDNNFESGWWSTSTSICSFR